MKQKTEKNSTMKIIFSLTEEDIVLLNREVKGTGGWQSFLENLRNKISGNSITLEMEDVLRVIRYSKGQGGYQSRLGSLHTQILELEKAILEMENTEKQ